MDLGTSSFIGLLNNAILLLALGFIYDLVNIQRLKGEHQRQLVSGLLIGLIGVAVMSTPWQLVPGVFFDTRWVLTSVSALFFGWLPALLASAIMVAYRLFQGGDGALVGSLVIMATALTGLLWRHVVRKRNWKMENLQFYLFGILVELVFFACVLLMPESVRWQIITRVGPPVLILFPVVSLLLCILLQRQQRNREMLQQLRNILEGTNAGSWEWDLQKMRLDIDERLADMLGYPLSDLTPFAEEKWNSLVHPADLPVVRQAIHRHLKGETETYNAEYRLRHGDNHWLWVNARGKATRREASGRALLMSGTLIDISDRKSVELQVRLNEKLFRESFNVSPVAASISRVSDGQYFAVNHAYSTTFGWSRDELLDNKSTQIGLWPYPEEREAWLDQLERTGVVYDYCVHLADRNGKALDIELSACLIDYDDQPCILTMLHDVTERRRTEEQVRTLSQVVEQSPVSVVITDTRGLITYVNQAFERISGYSAEESIGQPISMMKSEETPSSHYRELWQTISSGNAWTGEFQNCKKSGEIFWERAHIAPIVGADGRIGHYLAVKEDITLQKMQEEQILKQAHYDSLTDLPNRLLALDRLSQQLLEADRLNSKVAVLFIDLDDFKKVNDSLGHEVGDALLQQAAQRLKGHLRERDTVGRLGGDEFIVLLGNMSIPEQAQPIAEQCLSEFRKPFLIGGRELVLTASIGISIYPEDGRKPAELLRNADTAMYHSKAEGRNTYHYFTEAMNQSITRRLLLEEQLHGALKRQELEVLYQPQVRISDRAIVGCEALMRWHHPELGGVSPVEFIPIAEQTGLIEEMGQFVLTQTLQQLRHWKQKHGICLCAAVNISPRQFRNPGFVDSVCQLLAEHDVAPEQLELEVTEGVLMSGQSQVDRAIEELNKLGVIISMDDFGTGYSSLSYLRSYPFDVIKIDRSFVRDINADQGDRELVNATIAMAHGLGLRVVAEGVEDEAQLAHLESQGCDIAQGYLFGKPMSPAALELMLLQHKTGTGASLAEPA